MPPSAPVSQNALRAMIATVVVILFVAIYANVQKVRRDKIEKAIFVPASASSVTPPPGPTP